MEGIRTIGMSMCITLVVTSIFSMLIPDSKLDKVLKFAISLFFLTSIISPFFTSKIDFGVDFNNMVMEQTNTKMDKAVEEQFFSLAQKNIASTLERYLKNEEISVRKIEVFVNKTADNNISISKLMVYIDASQENKVSKIESLVKREVGVTPSIVKLNSNQGKDSY
ncbi:stage III sporulation protein AF [Paludicola sp. MB14-C6]|uniref:stage III sporulation protein AF n=1 Tax=Paludihabitans sp. MB14-C6 TaxID=3070656 RepID=UPI0027DC101C|nr:stage III sporulation protein AF [Paludicola sp. MB14-C6]WMJ23025.1 stage III sporulation protein AF [Paludicola sp. MB14-C6]